MFRLIWGFFTDLRTSFWLLLFTSVALIIGAYGIQFFFQVFDPLNDMHLQEWYARHGSKHWEIIWWIPMLFFLLFLLGVNTFCCTLKRLLVLISRRYKFSLKNFIVRLSPSVVHFCFLAIITGHLLSEIAGVNQVYKVLPGQVLNMGNNIQISVVETSRKFYHQPQSLQGSLQSCSLTLEVQQGEKSALKTLTFLEPASFAGHTFNLVKVPKGDKDSPFKLQVRRDPGLVVIVTGFVVMMFFLLWYYLHSSIRTGSTDEEENVKKLQE